MSNITAAKVKELRERTGVGMMDCKKALEESKGELDAAIDWLRTKGLATAAKKAGRTAAEGLVGVSTQDTKGAIIEVNSETDFVAKNETFQDYVRNVAEIAVNVAGDKEALEKTNYPGSDKTVAEQLTTLIASIGENLVLRRSAGISVSQGLVGSYIHSAAAPNIGRIGVLVALESSAPSNQLEALAKQIAMHIAATNPQACTIDELDKKLVERERAVYREQALESGKPAEFVDKMIEGRLRKFYEQVVLFEQSFIMDSDRKISQVVADAAKEAGTDITLKGYIRFGLGEGIEKEEKDFAAEVAAQLGQ
jgi:elongation factor Ts